MLQKPYIAVNQAAGRGTDSLACPSDRPAAATHIPALRLADSGGACGADCAFAHTSLCGFLSSR